MKIFFYANAFIACLIMTLNTLSAFLGAPGSSEKGTQQLTLMIVCLSAIWIHDAVVKQQKRGDRR